MVFKKKKWPNENECDSALILLNEVVTLRRILGMLLASRLHLTLGPEAKKLAMTVLKFPQFSPVTAKFWAEIRPARPSGLEICSVEIMQNKLIINL